MVASQLFNILLILLPCYRTCSNHNLKSRKAAIYVHLIVYKSVFTKFLSAWKAEIKRISSVSWLTPQMTTRASSETSWSQEPGTPSCSPTWMAGTNMWAIFSCPVRYISRKRNRQQSSQDFGVCSVIQDAGVTGQGFTCHAIPLAPDVKCRASSYIYPWQTHCSKSYCTSPLCCHLFQQGCQTDNNKKMKIHCSIYFNLERRREKHDYGRM